MLGIDNATRHISVVFGTITTATNDDDDDDDDDELDNYVVVQ